MSTREIRKTILGVAVVLAVACGQASSAAVTTTSSPSPSLSPSPSPSSVQPLTYSGQLTFSGGVSGTFAVKAPSGGSSNACGGGAVDVAVVIQGQEWDLGVSASPFNGPGSYTVAAGLSVLISTPSADIWMSVSGAATYTSDRSLSLDIAITNLMAGPGEPGANARVKGTMSCGQ